jgi:outer membrane protein OmpA-like peptidoglycan-associated protein
MARLARNAFGIACLFCLLITSPAKAQSWQAGFMFGAASYQGDLKGGSFGYKGAHAAYGASLHRNLGTRFSLSPQIMYGTLGMNDRGGSYPNRNLSFDTRILELSVLGRVNLTGSRTAAIVPYLSGGLAMYHINPFAFDKSGTKVFLYPLSTEGQGLSQYPNAGPNNKIGLALPFGPGLDIRLGKRLRMDIEAVFRKAFSDYIDDVSTSYPDRAVLLAAKGAKAVEMSYRGGEVAGGSTSFPSGSSDRGNPDKKDWYHTLNVRLRVPLGKEVTKKVEAPAPIPVTTPAPVVTDRDRDGIPDADDKCPDVAGLAKYAGCPIPDTDKDGINDEQDKCPTQPGLPKYGGCPMPDADGDGVADEDDKCRTVPGPADNGGCPRINFNADNIQFATGTANLTPVATKELDKLVKILNVEYPDVRIAIEGHTDNVGKPESNQLLSEKRANAVRDYLIRNKVDGGRLQAIGYGQTQPVADNATPEGRTKNRRVAFRLS